MNLDDFLNERRSRLLEMARERIAGERPTMLSMPFGAEFGRPVRNDDLERIRRMRTEIEERDIAFDPSFNNYEAWLYMFGVPYSAGPAKTVTMRSLPPFRNRNSDWDRILNGLNHVGRPSGGGEFMRPVGPWLYDLVKEKNGYAIMEAAHVLAHARAMVERKPIQDMRYRGFLETLAELVIANRYGMTIKVPETSEIIAGKKGPYVSEFHDCGIRPVISTNMRKPWIIAGMQNGGLTLFRDSVVVLVGIHLEPQPWSAREGNPNADDESWLEMNRWSCMPSIVSISGWVGIDELSKAPAVTRTGGQDISAGSFVMPVTAIDGPSSLDGIMSKPRTGEDLCHGIMRVETFLESDELRRLKNVVAPLPCRECLRLNMSAEGAPSRPVHKRPDPDDRRPNAEAVKEWAEYDAKIDKIFDIVKKASDFHFYRFNEGGRRILKERRRNARFVSETIGKLKSYETRARSLATKGFTDKAAAIRKKGRESMNRIFNLLEGGDK